MYDEYFIFQFLELDILRDDLEDLRSKKVQYDSKVNHLTSERNSLFNEKLQLEAKQQDRSNMEEKKEQLEKQINKDDQGDFTIFSIKKFLIYKSTTKLFSEDLVAYI